MKNIDLLSPEAQDVKALPKIGFPPVQAFSPELLPPGLSRFVQDVSERMACPPDYVAVSALVTMGAAVGNGLTIRPKAEDPFCLPANLWGGIIGDPSQKKTPAIKSGMASLGAIDKDLQAANEKALQEHALEVEKWKIRCEKKKKEARGDGAYSYEPPTEPERPPQLRAIVNNATCEKLGELMAENPRGLLLFRDELAGWLADFERSGRESERAFYLEAWDGLGSFTFDRIGRGTLRIDTACVSVLGAIQPGVFNALLKAEHSAQKADGLLQRFSLLVWPEPRPFEYIDRQADLGALKTYEALIHRLRNLDQIGQSDERSTRPYLRFTPDAQAAYISWLTRLMSRIQSELMPEAKAAHLAKYQKALPVLALLFELAENPAPQAVSLEAWSRAELWGEYLESHLGRVYPQTPTALEAAHAVAERWQSLPDSFTGKDIYSKCWKDLTDTQAVNDALDLLASHGWLVADTGTTPMGGRPSTTFTKQIEQPQT